MPDFLQRMADSSAARAARARASRSEGLLLARVAALSPPAALRPGGGGFDVIAEFKRRSPSTRAPLARGRAEVLARRYEEAGAAAVSVLTEPDAFGGGLEDLEAVARAVSIPVLRKDFLVDPYQVLEARGASASAVLLIVRILPGELLGEMLAAARDCGLAVLLESFDEADLARAARCAEDGRMHAPLLLGVNARDLSTLAVDRGRLARLRSAFPVEAIPVAESGIESVSDVCEVARLCYRMALVGSALVRAQDPAGLCAGFLAAGREEVSRCASS